MEFKVISFYKYIEINNPEELSARLRELCNQLGILGRILISKEGINGAVSGKIVSIEEFKRRINEFFEINFREQEFKENAYHKLVIRIRNQIVNFGIDVDLDRKGKYIESEELKKMLDEKEDFVLLDTRNKHEIKVGRFRNAVDLGINSFREFPKNISKLDKDKKIVMYCTGGVRCEKASAFLNENGFKDVNQLQGGIIDYTNKFNEHFEGSCFVFDDRLTYENSEPITRCMHCDKLSGDYINCNNLDCDELFICCKDCEIKMKKTCCLECKDSGRQRKVKKILNIVGKVINYYKKPKIALVELDKDIKVNSKLGFIGKTTDEFSQEIFELKDFYGKDIKEANKGDLVTFPVDFNVRKNDKLFLI